MDRRVQSQTGREVRSGPSSAHAKRSPVGRHACSEIEAEQGRGHRRAEAFSLTARGPAVAGVRGGVNAVLLFAMACSRRRRTLPRSTTPPTTPRGDSTPASTTPTPPELHEAARKASDTRRRGEQRRQRGLHADAGRILLRDAGSGTVGSRTIPLGRRRRRRLDPGGDQVGTRERDEMAARLSPSETARSSMAAINRFGIVAVNGT